MVLALLLVVPAALTAQSGRKRPDPTPTPSGSATQRPRRTTPAPAPTSRPAINQPGQPATPDEARPTPTPSPTPAPLTTNDAATGQAVEIDPDEVIRVNSNLVPIPASVIDDSGRAVVDLQVNDFELRVDGQPRPIGDLSRAETPVRLALLFDNSYSLRAARELEKQSAVRFFRTVIRPVDQAAIFSVSTEPIMEMPLTSDVNRLVRVIEHYGDPEGATALLDTIVQAADYLKPQTGRKVIVIVSDGVDTVSNTDFAETVKRVQSADCQVYAVQNNISENANLRDLTAEKRLQELAVQTGGAVFAPRNINDLPAAFAQISADLAQQYIVSYYPEEDRRDTRFRIISLRIKTRPGMRVRARRGYYPRQSQLTAAPHYTYNLNEQSDAHAPAPTPYTDQTNNTQPPTPTINRASMPATGPSYGSKNLNPDDEVATPQRAHNEPTARPVVTNEPARSSTTNETTRPVVLNETAPPGPTEVARPPEARVELASTSAPPPAPTPTATPEPTPAPTPTPTPAAPKTAEPQTTSTSSAAAPQRPLPGGVLNSRALKLPKPLYPDTARRMRVTGAVNVEVTIDESGKVIAAHAASGHMLLREAAVAAARQARFTPTIVRDKAVQVAGVIIYNFSQ